MNVCIFIYFLFCFVSFLIYCCRQYNDYFEYNLCCLFVLFSFDLSQVQYKREKKATSMNEFFLFVCMYVYLCVSFQFPFYCRQKERNLQLEKRYVFQNISFYFTHIYICQFYFKFFAGTYMFYVDVYFNFLCRFFLYYYEYYYTQ